VAGNRPPSHTGPPPVSSDGTADDGTSDDGTADDGTSEDDASDDGTGDDGVTDAFACAVNVELSLVERSLPVVPQAAAMTTNPATRRRNVIVRIIALSGITTPIVDTAHCGGELHRPPVIEPPDRAERPDDVEQHHEMPGSGDCGRSMS
jgi:hypothetical protein